MTPEKQLNLRLRHPDFQKFLDINEHESRRIKDSYPSYTDQKYGSDPLQSVDIFPATVSNAPVLVFIHGGYWRGLDKASYSFVAEPFIEHNMTVCILNYRLIPAVNMGTLLNDIRDGIAWIMKEAHAYNGNPDQVILSGHSAGGHLALMAYLMNENLRSGIRAICSLSAIFDLEPVKNSYLNEVLQLSEKDVKDYSVSNKDLSAIKCPVLLSVGANETDLFVEQSRKLYMENRSSARIDYLEYARLNHYEIVHGLGQKDSPLVNFILGAIDKKGASNNGRD